MEEHLSWSISCSKMTKRGHKMHCKNLQNSCHRMSWSPPEKSFHLSKVSQVNELKMWSKAIQFSEIFPSWTIEKSFTFNFKSHYELVHSPPSMCVHP